jgi:hypothetical protein
MSDPEDERPPASDAGRDETEPTVVAVRRCLKRVRETFERCSDPSTAGPGLYVAVVSDGVEGFADPLGGNRWPTELAGSVRAESDRFAEAAATVARDRDGAVVVDTDGRVRERMVRFHTPAGAVDVDYEDWMGTRHMSALEVSARPGVVATLTLSEETGRVTVFRDGRVRDVPAPAADD